MARLGPGEDARAAAHRFRPAVDDLMERQAEWGILLAPEEARRLAKVARTLAAWADTTQFDRWFEGVLQQLTPSRPPHSNGGPR